MSQASGLAIATAHPSSNCWWVNVWAHHGTHDLEKGYLLSSSDFVHCHVRIPMLVAWRVGFESVSNHHNKSDKGCLGWWLQSVSIFEIYEAGLPFSQNTNEKRNQWKMLGVLKNAKLFLKVVWHVIGWHRLLGDQLIPFHQLLYFPYSVSNRKYNPFFFETNGACASSLVMNCLPSCPVNDPSIWPTNKTNEKNHRILKRWLDVGNSGVFLCFC